MITLYFFGQKPSSKKAKRSIQIKNESSSSIPLNPFCYYYISNSLNENGVCIYIYPKLKKNSIRF